MVSNWLEMLYININLFNRFNLSTGVISNLIISRQETEYLIKIGYYKSGNLNKNCETEMIQKLSLDAIHFNNN